MGGTWMMLIYGLGGMRDDDGDVVILATSAPEDKRHTSVSLDVSRPDSRSRNRSGEVNTRCVKANAL